MGCSTPIVARTSSPNLAYDDPADRQRFAADYALILGALTPGPRRGLLMEGLVLRTIRNAADRRIDLAGRTLYYRFVYGRRSLPGFLAARVAGWEAGRPRGDTPQPAQSWDEQYRGGHWAFLHQPGERARYSVIVGLLAAARDPEVLDVGCGDGALYLQFRPYGYTRYVGLDVSQAAIDRATAAGGPDATFHAADASTYEPQGRFDAIVFNEMLYYLDDPVPMVRRYAQALAPGGRIIVSTWQGSPRSAAVLRQLREALPLVEETHVSHGRNRWTLTVFTPAVRRAS